MLTEEQSLQIKEQLLKQLDNFPENQREVVQEKIMSMTTKEVEEFIRQNQLTHLENQKKTDGNNCIFCSIVNKAVSSYILDEDKESLAVLEINPLSRGHSLILPKKHGEVEGIPSSAFTLAKKISRVIKKKLKPKEIKISTQKITGHSIIEVLPLYGNETERKKASEKELQETIEIIKIKKIPKETRKIKKETDSILPKLKPRIP
jgi:histidine triad (HIT) family protein